MWTCERCFFPTVLNVEDAGLRDRVRFAPFDLHRLIRLSHLSDSQIGSADGVPHRRSLW